MRITTTKLFLLLISFLCSLVIIGKSTAADRLRFAYPAKSLNYLPITLGRDRGIFQAEGVDLQMVLVTSTIQVTALTTGKINVSGGERRNLNRRCD